MRAAGPAAPPRLASANAVRSHYLAEIQSQGFTVEHSNDPAAFASVRKRFPDQKVHPAFNTDTGAVLDPREFVWLHVRWSGKTAGVLASRLYTGSLEDLADTRRLWGRDCPTVEDLPPFPFAVPSIATEIGGRVSLQGGAILAPDLRGKGLFIAITRLLRVICYRHWREDWQIALFVDATDPNRTRFPSYGYDRIEPLFTAQPGAGPDPRHRTEFIAFTVGASALAMPGQAPEHLRAVG